MGKKLALVAAGVAVGFFLVLQVLVWGFGCQVDEAGVHPCVVGGHDFGPLLANVTLAIVMASFVAGPLLLLGGLVVMAVLGVRAILRGRRRPDTPRNDPATPRH